MLRVMFLPPEPGFWDCLRDERQLMGWLAVWIIVLACLSALIAPKGAGVYFDESYPADCKETQTYAASPDDEAIELPRDEQLALAQSLEAP